MSNGDTTARRRHWRAVRIWWQTARGLDKCEEGTLTMAVLRIFSYLPNPRVWKAAIAARLLGVGVEVVGDRPKALPGWLWDFDARPLEDAERTPANPHARASKRGFDATLYKTDAFLRAHPFGTVPAAFDPSGGIGVFESNSILRAVARAGGGLYGDGPYEASRIDSFLDAGLTFAREAQVYLLALTARKATAEQSERMREAYAFYMDGIDNAAGLGGEGLAGPFSIADIAFVCDLAQFRREERMTDRLAALGLAPIYRPGGHARALAHFDRLRRLPAFAADLDGYVLETGTPERKRA